MIRREKKLKSFQQKTDLLFSDSELFYYFRNLSNVNLDTENYSTTEPSVIEEETDLHFDSGTAKEDETMNNEISFDEVKQMWKKLKNGKSLGLDILGAELLKHLLKDKKLLYIFTKLFNKLLISGNFPKE